MPGFIATALQLLGVVLVVNAISAGRRMQLFANPRDALKQQILESERAKFADVPRAAPEPRVWIERSKDGGFVRGEIPQ